jgi:hypothetical protein
MEQLQADRDRLQNSVTALERALSLKSATA